MAIMAFPPISKADSDGLLAIGGDLEVSSLLLAYTQGIFPWPISETFPLAWFSPDPRGILSHQDIKISSSLKKFLRKNPFTVTFNQAFHQVIENCALSRNRKEQHSLTWITPSIIQAYCDFFKHGHAYSVDVWLEGELVGGLYGVSIGNYISGESMFFNIPNASKVALLTLMKTLKEFSIEWIDTQMVTPVVESLGGKLIARSSFVKQLENSIDNRPLSGIFQRKTSLCHLQRKLVAWEQDFIF